MEKEEYIKKWLEGRLTEEETTAFRMTGDYEALEKLSDALVSFKAPEYDVTKEYERLRARKSLQSRVIPINWFARVLKVAAVLLMVTGSYFFFFYNKATKVETLAAESKMVTLPDASTLVLNAMSRISFNEKTWDERRRVELEGEGFFKVAKGSRFDVVTSQGTISVLGTAFNVSNREDFFEVICYEGSVQVESAQESVRLLPGEFFLRVDGVVTKDEKIATAMPDWRRGESSFRSIPYHHVVEEFERQFNVTVTTRNVDTRRLFTGAFTHSDFAMALESIALPFNLTYEVEGKKIILTGGN